MASVTKFICDRCGNEIPKVLLDGYDEAVSQRASVAISTKPSYEVRVDADLCLPCGEVVAQAVLHLLEGTTPLERDGADESLEEARGAGLVAGGDDRFARSGGAARFVAVSSEPRPEHHRPACEQDVTPPAVGLTTEQAVEAGLLPRERMGGALRDRREDVVGGDVTEGGTR